MPVVVLQKPKEKQVRKGWRVKTATRVIVKQKPRENLAAKRQASRSAHNYLLLREFGVKAPVREEGLLDRAKGLLGRIFGKK